MEEASEDGLFAEFIYKEVEDHAHDLFLHSRILTFQLPVERLDTFVKKLEAQFGTGSPWPLRSFSSLPPFSLTLQAYGSNNVKIVPSNKEVVIEDPKYATAHSGFTSSW